MFSCCQAESGQAEEKFDAAGTGEYGAVLPADRVMTIQEAAQKPEPVSPTSPVPPINLTSAAEKKEFIVQIQKDTTDTPIGCHLDISDGVMLRVCGIRTGSSPVQSYNESQAKDGTLPQVQIGDFVVKVNTVEGNALRLGEEIRKAKALELTIRRPESFTCVLNKEGGSLGLDLNYAVKGTSLVIDNMTSGAAEVWNSANPDKLLKKGDHIISINGKEGSSMELLEDLGRVQDATIVISRPASV